MHVFFSGIGGAGIGSLAEVAHDAGYVVSGSDLHESLVSLELERRGTDIVYEQSTESIAAEQAANPIDWLVYSSALPNNAPELVFARDNHIRISKRDEFLAEFIKDHNLKLIAVAGTHGKTTTTAMLVWCFKQLNLPISYSIGSTISFGASGQFDEKSEYFIYEADEYDRNFLAYKPEVSLITSLDYDHADIYPTKEDYDDAFREFLAGSKKSCMWEQTARQLFGDPKQTPIGVEVLYPPLVDVYNFQLTGRKMREDATIALSALITILHNIDVEELSPKLVKILNSFPGTARRFEKVSENLYSDYAHAPAEIAATMEKAREIANKSGQKVVAVYQPHQNLRQTEIVKEGGYSVSFDNADKIYWVPTYLVRGDLVKDALEVLTPEDLIRTLSQEAQENAKPKELNENLWLEIQKHLAANDLVVVMGAGPIDAWLREQLTK